MPSVSDLMVRSLINADPEYFMFGVVFWVLFCDPEVSVNKQLHIRLAIKKVNCICKLRNQIDELWIIASDD